MKLIHSKEDLVEKQSIKKIRMAIKEEFGQYNPEKLLKVFHALLGDLYSSRVPNEPTFQERYGNMPEKERRYYDFMMHM